MKIKLTTVFVDDQEKALRFYTDVLGFVEEGRLHPGSVSAGSPSLPPKTPTAP